MIVQNFTNVQQYTDSVVSRPRNTRTDNNMAAIFTCVVVMLKS